MKSRSKGLYTSESDKYLGVKVDTGLHWLYRVSDLSIKLNRDILFKMRYVSFKILRSIYFAIFDSNLSYYSPVWTQNCSAFQ